MVAVDKTKASLENLVESEDLGFEILHPGGLGVTQELAELCGIEQGTYTLEVASGTGESACYLAEKLGARVVGIDGSDYMVSKAAKKAMQRNLAVEFKRADAHHLPFADNTFDVVISECTMCILEKEKAIREMLRVAKPGGRIGFHDICWKHDTPERMKKRLAEIEGERPETLKGWKALCERAGLVDVQAVDRSYIMPTWMKETTRNVRFTGILKIIFKILTMWGIPGLMDVWESERIFGSKFTGYGIFVGRKSQCTNGVLTDIP